ncbi:MAG TPA: 3-oxoacyl-[acyl-carrier-protein] synthase III C-terminal domain-containing protein [Sandaracinaceae bacterium]
MARIAARVLPSFERREGFLERFFERVGVVERHLALPAEDYALLSGLEDRSRVWLRVATELGAECITKLLDEAGVTPADVGQLTTTTVTGIAVPSVDARLMNVLPFSRSLKRVPLFGLGCLGGAAGLARTAEYLRAYPDQLAILLSIELCSLTLQQSDASLANVISSGLFGDGAAAVLLAGPAHPLARSEERARAQAGGVGGSPAPGPDIVASRSAFFPNTERVMGWDVVDGGFKVVLSPSVPDVVRAEVPPLVDAFLAEHELTREDIATWVSHPGGPKVLAALEDGLGLPRDALRASREALAAVGNLSSASVLYLLDDYRRNRVPPPGSYGLLMAMGPAFCAELVLLRW